MVAETEIVCQQNIQVLDVDQYKCLVANNGDEIQTSSVIFQQIQSSVSIPIGISLPEVPNTTSDDPLQSAILQFVPTIRSGSSADIGPRNFMEDEHIRIDDLSSHLGSILACPTPSAFYGVFDGHGGPEAAAYMKKNALRFLFQDVDFPPIAKCGDVSLEEVENSTREAFLLADLALAEECTVSNSTGTTALTAMILGRLLLVANIGDCRAVLCRKGEAIEMSQDHKPIHSSERRRIEQSGGYIDNGYLNGVLSVSRALGDWDMKMPRGSSSPLIAEPELFQTVLTEDDEFLILGCDGIWDVISSQQAVNIVRRGLRRHDDPEQSAKDLVMEALCLGTFDNLTVIVICFFPSINKEESSSSSPTRRRRLKFCGLSTEALCNLKRFL